MGHRKAYRVSDPGAADDRDEARVHIRTIWHRKRYSFSRLLCRLPSEVLHRQSDMAMVNKGAYMDPDPRQHRHHRADIPPMSACDAPMGSQCRGDLLESESADDIGLHDWR